MREFDNIRPAPVPDVFIHLGLTARCESRCIKCNVWRHSPPTDLLRPGDWVNIIRQLDARFDNAQITLSGGEPLLMKGIYELNRAASETRLHPVLNTSGHSITRRVAKKLVDSGCRYVYLSLDGLDRTADAVKGLPGAYRKTVRAMDLLRREDPDMLIGLVYVMMRQNLGETISFAEHFSNDERIAEIRYQPVFQPVGEPVDPGWWRKSDLWPDPDQADGVIDELIRMKLDGYPITNSLESLNIIRAYFKDPGREWSGACPVGRKIFVIDPEGMVYFCLEMEPVGNATWTPIAEILRSPRAEKCLEKIASCRRRFCHLPILGGG